jgi:hypothetical protein
MQTPKLKTDPLRFRPGAAMRTSFFYLCRRCWAVNNQSRSATLVVGQHWLRLQQPQQRVVQEFI